MRQYFLIGESDNVWGEREIVEPVGMDGNIFTVTQSEKFARSIYFSGEEVDLEFWKGFWSPANTPQLMPDGSITDMLTMGYEFIMDYRKTYGFEAKMSLKITEDGELFSLGRLAFPISENNTIDIFKAKTVMNTEEAKMKRQEDTFVDAFSSVDLYGNPITPCSTFKVLVKAYPYSQYSKWISTPVAFNQVFYGADAAVVAPFTDTTDEGVETSYIPFQQVNYLPSTFTTDDVIQLNDEITLIRAKETLTNVKIKLNNVNITVADSFGANTNKNFAIAYGTNPTPGSFTVVDLEDSDLSILSVTNKDYELNIGELVKDSFLYIRLAVTSDQVPSPTPVQSTSIVISADSLEISAVSTATDSVVDAVWIYDLKKHNVNSVTSLPYSSPRFDIGGKYNLQVGYDGWMMRQFVGKPFVNKPKDLFGSLGDEINFDLEVSENGVFFGHERDFYTNVECGVLEINSINVLEKFNPRIMLNTFDYGWGKYEQDKDEKNSGQSIHTELQLSFPNTEVKGGRNFKMTHVRDGAYKERIRRQNVSVNPSSAQSGDDDLFVDWVVEVPPGFKRGINARMQHYADGVSLKLINDGSYSWLLVPISVGGQFFVLPGSMNSGTYTIVQITRNVLVLSGIATESGSFQTQTEYFVQNVLYMTQGNEGYSDTSGIAQPENYANLNSTPKRNLQEYQEWFNSICSFHKDKDIKFTFRKNNVQLKSTKIGESEVDESTPIQITDNKLITANMYEVEAYSTMIEMKKILERVMIYRGFIRFIYGNTIYRGYFTENKHEIPNNISNFIIEEKYMGDYYTIESDGGVLKVTEIGQNVELGLDNFHYSNTMVQLFDNNSRPLTSPERFTKFKVGGVVYTNKNDFNGALIALLG